MDIRGAHLSADKLDRDFLVYEEDPSPLPDLNIKDDEVDTSFSKWYVREQKRRNENFAVLSAAQSWVDYLTNLTKQGRNLEGTVLINWRHQDVPYIGDVASKLASFKYPLGTCIRVEAATMEFARSTEYGIKIEFMVPIPSRNAYDKLMFSKILSSYEYKNEEFLDSFVRRTMYDMIHHHFNDINKDG